MNQSVKSYLSGKVEQGEGVRLNSRFINFEHYNDGVESYFANSVFTFMGVLPDNTLEQMFLENDTHRKGCRIPALEMTRAGVEFYRVDSKPDDKLIKAIEAEWEDLGIDVEDEKGIIESLKMGGGAAIINFDDNKNWDEPVDKSKGILSIKIIDRRYCTPLPASGQNPSLDMNSPDFGVPEYYQVNYPVYGSHFTQVVHKSRIIRYMPPYTGATNEAKRHGWGEPILTHVLKKLKLDETGHDEAAELIPKFITDIFFSDGAVDGIMRGNDSIKGDPKKRLNESFSKTGIGRIIALRLQERFEKVSANVSGLVDLMDKYPKRTAAAYEIPFSRLFYAEGAALNNSTVEEENKTFEKTIAGMQRSLRRPVIRRWLEVFSTYMDFDPKEIKFRFAPLSEASELEKAQIGKFKADTDAVYEGIGVVTASEIRDTRFKDKAVPDLEAAYQLDSKTEKMLADLEEHELNQPIESHDMAKELHNKSMNEDPQDKKEFPQ